MPRTRIPARVGLALGAVAAAVAVVLAAGLRSGGDEDASPFERGPIVETGADDVASPVERDPIVATAALSPRIALFGDTVTATVDVADNTLRCFAGFLVAEHPELVGFVDVRRTHIEQFKLFFVARLTVR